MEWLRHLYGEWRDSLASQGRGRAPVAGFDEFWAGNGIELPVASEPQVAFAEFRLDPDKHPLTTPTGDILDLLLDHRRIRVSGLPGPPGLA